MQLLDYQQILPHQIDLLSSQGPSLANFADRNNKKSIFTKSQLYMESDLHKFRMANIIKIKNSVNCNLQALALAFLRCIFQNSKNSDLLDHIKCSLYNKTIIFSKLKNARLQSLSDISIKKILAQFFQLLTFGNADSKVLAKVTKYPIIIDLLTSYFRVILGFLDQQQAFNGQSQLQTEKIYEMLFQFFDINFKIVDDIYLLLDDGIFISFKDNEYFVGDFIENIKKNSQPSQDGCSSDEQLVAFVKANEMEKNIMAINQIDQDYSQNQIGNSTPSFVTTQINRFQKKANIKHQGQFLQEKNQNSTPSFANINKEEINFKPKIIINQYPTIKECENQDDIPPDVRIRTRTIDVTHLWQGDMHDSALFQSNHESVVDTGETNPQNMHTDLPLLQRSYRLHCEQKASKPETPPPMIHKRNKSEQLQQLFSKMQSRNQPKQTKNFKPPPSFLLAQKKNQSPQKIDSQYRIEKKNLLEVVKQEKKANDKNSYNKNGYNSGKEKWLPFAYKKKQEKSSSIKNQKINSQIILKKTSLNCNNASNSYEKILTSSRQHECINVCDKCIRRFPKNSLKSGVVSININPPQQKSFKFSPTKLNQSLSPKKMDSLTRTNDTNFNIVKCSDTVTKVSTVRAPNNNNTSGQIQKMMINSSPSKNTSLKSIFVQPKQLVNHSHHGRTSAIYPSNSKYC